MENTKGPTARQLFLAGRVDEAIAVQRTAAAAENSLAAWGELAHYFFVKGDFAQAIDAYTSALALEPENALLILNIGLSHVRNKTFDAAKVWLDRALEKSPGLPQTHDALCTLAANVGDAEGTRHHGREALRLKDEDSLRNFQAYEVNHRPIPPFNPDARDKNILAFSLWGSHPMYLDNAVRNAVQAREIFPEWRCQFYCERSTVPEWTVCELASLDADVVLMEPQRLAFEGLFWRFRPVSDASLDRVLVRDVDSVVTYRERLAVQEWLASDRYFHLMRDHHTHTDLILAGLWGAVAGVLPPLADRIAVYMNSADKSKNADQRFLGAHYWPEVRRSAMIHDSQFGNFDARDFPANSRLDKARHVGGFTPLSRQFMSGKIRRESTSSVHAAEECPRRRRFIFTLGPGYCGTGRLADLLRLNAPRADVFHEREALNDPGLHTPDPSLIVRFNTSSNVPAVARFWLRKLNAIRYGENATYAETSHMLWLSGLLENLPLLGEDVEVHLIELGAPEEEIAWNAASSLVFSGTQAMRAGALDPAYPRNAVRPEAYLRHGAIGRALWYVRETAARAAAYRAMLSGRQNVRIHAIDAGALSDGARAHALLKALGLSPPNTIKMPAQGGGQAVFVKLPDEQRELLRKLIRGV